MRHFIIAAALSLASGIGLAVEPTCDKPEYLQLKSADRAELTEEYCRAKGKFDLMLSQQADYREMARSLSSQGLDSGKALEQGRQALEAGTSCHKASIEYLRAIERRFKPKRLPECK